MRITTALKAGLSAFAAILALTACGGGSDSENTAAESTSSSPATSSSAVSTSSSTSAPTSVSQEPDAEALAFCTEARNAFAGLKDDLAQATPDQLGGLLRQVVGTLDTLSPPAEIDTAFATLRNGYDRLATTVEGVDLSTPDGQTQFQAAFTELRSTVQPAQNELETWTDDNCPAESSTPTS